MFASLYQDLHGIAARVLRRERKGHTLQTTALLHEAYLRMSDREDLHGGSRERFFGAAANTVRHVLVDHARRRKAAKRGGSWHRIALEESSGIAATDEIDVLDLDEALEKLAGLHERQARIVELRFFGGLTVEEVADMLELSTRTVEGDWAMAKAWLQGQLC